MRARDRAASSAPTGSAARPHAWRHASRGSRGFALAFLVLLLGATATLYLRGELARYPFSLRIVFVTIGGGLRPGGALRRRAAHRASDSASWRGRRSSLDQLTWTAIVYVTGGATSGATSFYALTCLVGAILVGPARGRGGRRRSASASMRSLCAGFHFGWVLPPADQADGALRRRRRGSSSIRCCSTRSA